MNTMTKRETKQIGYAVAVVMNVIVWYVINNLLNWNVQFITPRFADVLWAFNLSIGATAVTNAFYIIYNPGWFHHLTQMVLAVLAFNSVYVLRSVFPFDFPNATWDYALRLALLMAMVAAGIAFVVELVKLISGKE